MWGLVILVGAIMFVVGLVVGRHQADGAWITTADHGDTPYGARGRFFFVVDEADTERKRKLAAHLASSVRGDELRRESGGA